MSRAAALAALLAAAAALAADPADLFGGLAAPWAEKGWAVRERISRSDGPTVAAAVVYGPADPRSREGDRLEVYLAAKGSAHLAYAHPASAERLELDGTPAGRFGELGGGSKLVAYRATTAGVSTLHLLAWKGPRVGEIAAFPAGRFERLDGALVVVSRERALADAPPFGCPAAESARNSALRTTVRAWRSGRFVDAGPEHPAFFEDELRHEEAALVRLRKTLARDPGAYLASAVALYEDFAALGRESAGRRRLLALLAPAGAPPEAARCLKAARPAILAALSARKP